MEIIREKPNKVFAKSNTSNVVRFLAFIAVALVLLVLGVCLFVVFGRVDKGNYHLDSSEEFYFSLNNGKATFEDYLGGASEYVVPETVTYNSVKYPITEISAQAFTNHRELTILTIGDHVEKIGGAADDKKTGAFSGCVNLSTINWGKNVSRIESYAFKNCVALTELNLPKTMLFVGEGAFMNCLELTTLSINGNCQFAADSLLNCQRLTTLQLSDDVQLGAYQKKALARLTNLTTIKINEENALYQVVDHCLVGNQGKNLVLGACGVTEIPDEIVQIEDYAFGDRFGSNEIELPNTVTVVGLNSFANGEIYTALKENEKPQGWATELTIHYEAHKIDFYRNYDADDQLPPVTVFVYKEGNQMVMPKYEDLFGATDTEHIFSAWGTIDYDHGVCLAEYDHGALASAEEKTALETMLETARSYLGISEKDNSKFSQDLRASFSIPFWENFKSAFGLAEIQFNNSQARGYQIEVVKTALQKYLNVLAQPSLATEGDLRSGSWASTLSSLINLSNQALEHRADYTANNSEWTALENAKTAAQLTFEHMSDNETQCEYQYKLLRDAYEALRGNLTALSQVIADCGDLNAHEYTEESWQAFETALSTAQHMTKYNLSILSARTNLSSAFDGLSKVANNLATEESLITLGTWASICLDLDETQYTQASYDWFSIKVLGVIENLNEIKKESDVANSIKTLTTAYEGLVGVEKPAVHYTSTPLSTNALPYFLVAVVLFTGAVIAYAVASSLKRNQRPKNRE